MIHRISRRQVLALLASIPAWFALGGMVQKKKKGGREIEYRLPESLAEFERISVILGRATGTSITASLLANEAVECYLEHGSASGALSKKTEVIKLEAGKPVEVKIDGLQPDTAYAYRLRHRKLGEETFAARTACRFHTARAKGSTFAFAIQGDSHPERAFMNNPDLYARTLQHAAQVGPDFYICMGDDFSISTLPTLDAASIEGRYTLQRPFLGLVGQGAPVFLLNGNHEQASLHNYNASGEPHTAAVLAQNARNKFYPTVAPNEFYSGNDEPLKEIGPLKDYYSWTWGDALFVVLDNYWHSPAQVDSGLGEKGTEGKGQRDLWDVTLGERQYRWFKKVLEESKAKYKFVFAHHVLGTQRGGVDVSHLYEWGGYDKRGDNLFKEKRPGWDLPIHDLMVKHGVSIFFQGHDHLYCRQERDGVVYQEVPMPADHGYEAYNADRYGSGVKLPNSGYLKVTVSPEDVLVEYVRQFLPADEGDGKKSGSIAHSYRVKSRVVG